MIIDFHTHFFSDTIAEKTIEKLSEVGGIPPYSKGNLEDTIKVMDKSGVDISVLLPIATKPSQVTIINNWALNMRSDRIVPFGTIHPDLVNYKEEIKRIAEMGLKGIKLHPDYQDFFIDEKRMYGIYEYAIKCGLYISFHTGYDIGLGDPVHADSKSCGKIVDDFGGEQFILAHLGGYVKDEFEKYIMGKNVYVDTSYSLLFLENEKCENIIKEHGIEKVLFGTDLPWEYPKKQIDKIKNMKLTDEDKEKILGGNAKRILGL